MWRPLCRPFTAATRSTALLAAVAWLAACRQTPAPEHAPPAAPAAGQVVPVTPNPAPSPAPPPPAPASAEQPPPAPAKATPTPAAATPPVASTPVPRKPTAPKTPPATAGSAMPAKPAPVATATPAVPAPVSAPATAAVAPKPAAPALDLASLEQRLRDTKAIGVFTKLSLKNQVDDLLDEVRKYHRNPSNPPQPVVRQHFEGLMLKVLSSLQGGDPQLANTIASSREVLWGILIDPDKFSKI